MILGNTTILNPIYTILNFFPTINGILCLDSLSFLKLEHIAFLRGLVD